MLTYLLIGVICSYVLYRVTKKLLLLHTQYGLLEKMPGPPLKNKVLGHLMDMIGTLEEVAQNSIEQYKTYGGIFRLWTLGIPTVMIAKAEYAEVFLTAKNLDAKSDLYNFLSPWLGRGLLTSKGELWQQRRKLITPAFHFSVLNSFCDVFVKNSLTMIQKLHEHPVGSPVDVLMLMTLISLDNICETAMGIQIDALKNPKREYIGAVENATKNFMNRVLHPWYWIDLIFFFSPLGRNFTKALNTIFELTNKAISDGRNKRALKKKTNLTTTYDDSVGGKQKMAFLDLLLEASESSSISLSDKDLRDEVNTFMFEGHETVAVALSFTLYLLGLHQEIQVKCQEELESIFQGSDRKPTVEDLQNMKYLEQVIKESLRLLPSVPIISRQVQEDLKIGDFTVPEGTTLALHVYNLHRDPKVFPEPQKFDPDRFSTDNCARRHPYAYVPFSAGARNCIGQKYAMMEEKFVLSYILRHFSLESAYGMDELRIIFCLVIRPIENLHVQFYPRELCKNDKK